MFKMKLFKYFIFIIIVAMAVVNTACIEDDFTSSSSDTLTFSTDTLAFDTIFTELGTPTKTFIVYNRHSKMLNISSIKLAGTSAGKFYLNIDGVKSTEFNNVEIRGNDSIYVFVEAYINPTNQNNPVEFNDQLQFVTNGVTQNVVITAWGQDVTRLRSTEISTNTHLTADRPYLVYDTLKVDKGATLTIDPGATICFHDKGTLKVDGTLLAMGTQEKPITMRGDRLDHVVGSYGYDIMSGQWNGVDFGAESFGNEMQYVLMRGSSTGVTVDSTNNVTSKKLHLFNSVLHNSSGSVLTSKFAWIEAEGCEFSDSKESVVMLYGGKVRFTQCTFANYYLFSAIDGPIIYLDDLFGGKTPSGLPVLDATFDNSIIYGNTGELNEGDLTGTNVFFRYCLLKSSGTNDANFLNCKWGGDPKFYTDRENYIFDYRLKNKSDAIAIGSRDLCPSSASVDRYGVNRLTRDGIDLGAYTWVEATEK